MYEIVHIQIRTILIFFLWYFYSIGIFLHVYILKSEYDAKFGHMYLLENDEFEIHDREHALEDEMEQLSENFYRLYLDAKQAIDLFD